MELLLPITEIVADLKKKVKFIIGENSMVMKSTIKENVPETGGVQESTSSVSGSIGSSESSQSTPVINDSITRCGGCNCTVKCKTD